MIFISSDTLGVCTTLNPTWKALEIYFLSVLINGYDFHFWLVEKVYLLTAVQSRQNLFSGQLLYLIFEAGKCES